MSRLANPNIPILACLTCFLVSSILSAATINVPGDSPTIQTGLNTASAGDTVLVAAGIYFENIGWPPTAGIKLIGADKEICFIDGNSDHRVINFSNNDGIIDSTTQVSGFTIQNGNVFGYGGGIRIGGCSPTLNDLNIYNNTAVAGGGLHLIVSSPTLNDVNIINNTTTGSTEEVGQGGGILIEGYTTTLNNVRIEGNSAGRGGGISIWGGDLVLENVTITANSATHGGGGIEAGYSSPTFSAENRCNIFSNISPTQGSDLYCYSSFIEVYLDTFTVIEPTEFYAYPIGNFAFDILNASQAQVNIDSKDKREGRESFIPDRVSLDQNYPNPFNPSTSIRYGLPKSSMVTLVLYDINGQLITELVNSYQPAGWYVYAWNGFSEARQSFSTGLYFARLQTDSHIKTIKMIYIQ